MLLTSSNTCKAHLESSSQSGAFLPTTMRQGKESLAAPTSVEVPRSVAKLERPNAKCDLTAQKLLTSRKLVKSEMGSSALSAAPVPRRGGIKNVLRKHQTVQTSNLLATQTFPTITQSLW